MRKKKEIKTGRGLRTLVIYGGFVFVLILISLTLRLFYLIGQSKFDGQHRFTMVIGETSKVLGVLSFEPTTSSLSLLTFSGNSNLSFSNFSRKLGVIPDGYVKSRYNLDLNGTIPSILQSFIFNSSSVSTNVNFYDLIRLYLYANKVPVSSIVVEEATEVPFLLADSAISAENVSVQIVNAAGQSGLGSRLERVISNLGGNVVSVKTALVNQPASKIQYYGEETYTLKKLKRLLPIKSEVLGKEDIARIIIIIGEDNKDTSLF